MEETKLDGGVAKFGGICRTEKCIWNVMKTCRKRSLDDQFCINKTNPPLPDKGE